MNGSSYAAQDVDRPTSNGVDCQPPQVFPPAALTVRLATKDETIQVRTATYASWSKGRMSLEQHPRRDAGEWRTNECSDDLSQSEDESIGQS